MENVSAGQSVGFFQVERGNDVMAQNFIRQVRCVLRQCLDHSVAKGSSLGFILPRSVLQHVRRVLHVDRHHVLAFRRKRRISQRRNCDFQVWRAREIAILRFIECTLQIIDPRPNVNSPS